MRLIVRRYIGTLASINMLATSIWALAEHGWRWGSLQGLVTLITIVLTPLAIRWEAKHSWRFGKLPPGPAAKPGQ